MVVVVLVVCSVIKKLEKNQRNLFLGQAGVRKLDSGVQSTGNVYNKLSVLVSLAQAHFAEPKDKTIR